MDDIVLQLADELAGMRAGLLDCSIKINDIPVDDLLNIIGKVFESESVYNDSVMESYKTILMSSARSNDLECFAAAFGLIVQELRVLSVRKTTIRSSLGREKRLRVRLSHYQNVEYVRNWYRGKGVNPDPENKYFTGKGCLYSVITGDYDKVHDPLYMTEGMDHILFTNNPNLRSDKWMVVYIEDDAGLDNKYLSRKYKLFPHEYLKDYDYSVYVDGSIIVKGDLRSLIDKYHIAESMLCFCHTKNETAYEEAEDCIKLGKGDPDTIGRQMERYREEGYAAENGIIGGGILFRDHRDDALKTVMNTWWDELVTGCMRDQLSFNYSCWKNDYIYDTFDLVLQDNDWFELDNHSVN